MVNTKLIYISLVFLLISFTFAAAEDVKFYAEIDSNKDGASDQGTISAGKEFDILIKLDVTQGKEIKMASFTLTPDKGMSINSADSGNLFESPTQSPNVASGKGWSYGEITVKTEKSGNGLLFAKLHATADNVDKDTSVTLTFTNLVAKRGNFARTTTSTPKTIEIKKEVVSYSCTGDIPTNSQLCTDDDKNLVQNTARTLVALCSDAKCEYICNNNYWNIDNNAVNGCEYSCTKSGAETCNGKDDDCNGQTDEGSLCQGGQTCQAGVCKSADECQQGQVQVCATGKSGVCGEGEKGCVGGKWGTCNSKVSASPEVCDNKDNDCDGQTDEGSLCPQGQQCQSGTCKPVQLSNVDTLLGNIKTALEDDNQYPTTLSKLAKIASLLKEYFK